MGIQSPRLPEHRDIVVIGSGVTGCSVAWRLLEKGDPKTTVAVMDAREICSGATGRNGGRIHCTVVQDYDKYSRLLGQAAARETVRFELAHLTAYHDFARELGPEVVGESEMRHLRVISAVFDGQVLEDPKRMLDTFKRDFPDLADSYDIIDTKQTQGAMVYNAGAVWPHRLITKAFQVARSRHGGRLSIETNTPVISVTEDIFGAQYLVKTPRGIISARHVVHCTEGHSAHLLPNLRGIVVPLKGQMTVQCMDGFPRSISAGDCYTFIFGQSFDYAALHPVTGEVWMGGGSSMMVEAAGDFLGEPSDAAESIIAKAHLSGILPTVLAAESPLKASISTKIN
ncbi:unnamed protein product [Clonostachys chloroleuca]|uniref:FAD dependent oxidoreductase domain-containing protein n=1 Tax=Clonostachys chloroleuca TaxID=1926264 RepID=A0AA35LTI2_9HYPO|nr:unnamed protein product [Clonostachys chloroleuca]